MDQMTGTITGIERLRNSVNGNPRFEISIDWERYITSSDHAFCYEVGNPGVRVGDVVSFTLSRAGRLTGLRAAGVAS